MEAVRKAASEAVDTIRNSPLFRRKFGNRSTEQESPETPRPLHPESDRTPFVQGVYFQVEQFIPHDYYCNIEVFGGYCSCFNNLVATGYTGRAWLPTCIDTPNVQILTVIIVGVVLLSLHISSLC